MPRHIKKLKHGYVLEDTKGKKYSKHPLSYKKALAQERAIYLSEHGLSNKHYGGSHWAVYSPEQQAINNVRALKKADEIRKFGQIYTTHGHNEIMRGQLSKPKFGGHLYYSNI